MPPASRAARHHLARGGLAEELLECHRRLADQHRQPVDRAQARRPRRLQQRRLERMGDNVVDHAARRSWLNSKLSGGWPAMPSGLALTIRSRQPGAIVEGEIGRRGEMCDIDRMMLALRIDLVEQRARLGRIAAGEDDDECPARLARRRSPAPRRRFRRRGPCGTGDCSCRSFRSGSRNPAPSVLQPISMPLRRGVTVLTAPISSAPILEPAEHRHDRLLVRHRDVAAAPIGIVARAAAIYSASSSADDAMRAVLAPRCPACRARSCGSPATSTARSDRRSLRRRRGSRRQLLQLAQRGEHRQQRHAEHGEHVALDALEQLRPPSASMRNTPTHWPTSGHSAAR